MVYEGARAITGPFLASLGASALLVGVVTGAGEAAALVLRLVSGPLADRSGRYWSLTIVGYALTAVCVPLMAVAPFLGGAGLAFGATMVLLERTGKAVRSPSKSALLAHAARAVGRGRGFAVHKALDQVGAFAGPLLVAGVIALTARTWAGLAVLAVPGAAAMALLVVVRRRVPDMTVFDEEPLEVRASAPIEHPTRLPRIFYVFAVSCAASTLGLMTFGIISFHLVEADLVRPAAVPLVYALAMAVEAVAALATGFAYDRVGARVLLALPVLVALVPLLAFADTLRLVLVGLVVWGLAVGIQDSTVKALVADLVPSGRLATAYGVFAAFQGAAALAGGALGGALYDNGVTDLVVVIGVCQAASLVLLTSVVRRRGAAG
ncbi:MFS transporter [Nocardioides sp. KIGAM211]|uniref:MFS transporter n=2 Tax=Nocardioides luti TaxID=2761101 RepID=A0A7X0VC55_9ACTN|nr:MFS transporter [Nocardioides luti]MBB6627898.1 MFS transporter [Nocardioides luti]